MELALVAAVASSFAWGVSANHTGEQSSVHLMRADACYQVEFRNRATRVERGVDQVSATLRMDGLEVTAEITMTMGGFNNNPPDYMDLTVPAGWYAEPRRIEVDEGAQSVIVVCPVAMS